MTEQEYKGFIVLDDLMRMRAQEIAGPRAYDFAFGEQSVNYQVPCGRGCCSDCESFPARYMWAADWRAEQRKDEEARKLIAKEKLEAEAAARAAEDARLAAIEFEKWRARYE